MKVRHLFLLIAFLLVFTSCKTAISEVPKTIIFNSIEISSVVLKKDLKAAKWLGVKYDGKSLLEPINVIITDTVSTTKDEAIISLIKACDLAGYGKKGGHSSGYVSIINNEVAQQLPAEYRTAFSDNVFWKVNNHGKFFDPFQASDGSWIFIGAFSRERFKLLAYIHHKYVSFNVARDDFASKMNEGTDYKINGKYSLHNLINTETEMTGDHDGNAIVLKK